MNVINKGNGPRPVRFADEDEALLLQLKELTGLSVSSLIRRSVRYCAPKFLDGSINLLTLRAGEPALALEKVKKNHRRK